jgi:hypothetical protein
MPVYLGETEYIKFISWMHENVKLHKGLPGSSFDCLRFHEPYPILAGPVTKEIANHVDHNPMRTWDRQKISIFNKLFYGWTHDEDGTELGAVQKDCTP